VRSLFDLHYLLCVSLLVFAELDLVGSKLGHVNLSGSLDPSFDDIKIEAIPELCQSTGSATALLAWDGKALNGKPLEVADTKPALILNARYYGDAADFKKCVDISVRLEWEHTVADVRKKLAEEVQLDINAPVSLSHMEYSRLVDIDAVSDKRPAFDVFTMDSDAVQVSFEQGSAELEDRLAYKDFQYRRSLLEICMYLLRSRIHRFLSQQPCAPQFAFGLRAGSSAPTLCISPAQHVLLS
jgi:hypothetical protein